MELPGAITEKVKRAQLPLLFLFVTILVVILYEPTAVNLFKLWLRFDESLGHGLLVFLVSSWLVWKAIDWKDNSQVSTALHASVPLLLCSLAWALAYSVDINIIQQMLLPLIFLASIYLLAGRQITLKILVPVLLFYFAIPVWDYLNGALLDLTALIVQTLVGLSNITAYVEGNSIFLPSGEIVIAHGCSGIRYFIIGLFLAVLSSYLYFENNLVRLLLIAITVFLSLLANWIRVYAIIMIAYQTKMQSPLVANHETLGWVVFMLFMIPLFYFNYRYQVLPASNEKTDNGINSKTRGSPVAALLLFIPAIAAGPVIAKVYEEYEHEGHIPVTDLETASLDIRTTVPPSGSWKPNIRAPAVNRYAGVNMGQQDIHYLVYGYKRTGENREILPYSSDIYNRDIWTVSQTGILTVENGKGNVDLRKLLLVNKYSGRQILLYYYYDIGGFTTVTYNIAKLLQIPATLSGNAWALITFIWSECNLDCEQMSDMLESRIPGMIN